MTAKPRLSPDQLKPTSGRGRMTIDQPVEVVREPDAGKAKAD